MEPILCGSGMRAANPSIIVRAVHRQACVLTCANRRCDALWLEAVLWDADSHQHKGRSNQRAMKGTFRNQSSEQRNNAPDRHDGMGSERRGTVHGAGRDGRLAEVSS